jgi:hypothetical protein
MYFRNCGGFKSANHKKKIGSANPKFAKCHICWRSANLTNYLSPALCGTYLRTAHLCQNWSLIVFKTFLKGNVRPFGFGGVSINSGLKVPFGQIGSTWEWYHWIGLGKDCLESCLPIGWLTFIWWKNPPKFCSILIWIAGCWNALLTRHNPKNNWCLSRIFGERFHWKDRSLSTCKQWSKQAGGWIHFCMKQLRTLNSYQIFKIKNKKNKNL